MLTEEESHENTIQHNFAQFIPEVTHYDCALPQPMLPRSWPGTAVLADIDARFVISKNVGITDEI